MFPFRVPLLRLMGATVGKQSSVGRSVHFETGLLSLGSNVRVGAGSVIDNVAKVEIGDWSRLSPEVMILTSTHDINPTGPFRRSPDDMKASGVVIERGCWICARAIILPGVRIAEGCVIAAGAVVHRDTVANGKYAGVPAKLIGRYGSPEVVQASAT